MAYIKNPEGEGCIFCNKPKSNEDGKNYLVYRGKSAFVMMNLYPYNSGHLMIAPYRHVERTYELTDEESREVISLLNRSLMVLEKAMNPEGFNVGFNLGRAAGAGMRHLHLHVVPRWTGDTNFMPVISETKVAPESLEATYEKLREAF